MLPLRALLASALAKASGLTAHGLTGPAIGREAARGQRLQAIVEEALAAHRAVEAGAEVYVADNGHRWL